MFFGKDIIVKDGKISIDKDIKLWYLPFNMDAKPILISQNKTDSPIGPGNGPGITISCYCTGTNQIGCDVEGTTTITCEGACIDITDPDVTGTCKMKVTVTAGRTSENGSKTIKASTGIIVASK